MNRKILHVIVMPEEAATFYRQRPTSSPEIHPLLDDIQSLVDVCEGFPQCFVNDRTKVTILYCCDAGEQVPFLLVL